MPVRARLALLAAPLAFALPAAAQDLAWSFGYDSPHHGGLTPLDLHALTDGGAISVMRSGSDVLAVQFSENGDREWLYFTSGPTASSSYFWTSARIGSAVDASGNLYLVYSRNSGGTLVKVGPDGAEQWRRTLPLLNGESYHPEFVAIDGAGFPLVGGTNMAGLFPHFSLRSYDPSGALLWTEESVVGGMHDLEVGPAGEIVAFGQDDVQPWQHIGKVSAYDANGSNTWSAFLASDGFMGWDWSSNWYDAVTAGDINATGEVAALLEGTFCSISPDDPGTPGFSVTVIGTNGWTRQFSECYEDVEGTDLGIDDQGRVTIVGTAPPVGGNGVDAMTVWHVDAAGALVGSDRPGGTAGRGGAVSVRGDGTAFVTGTAVGVGALHAEYRPDGSQAWLRSRTSPLATGGAVVEDARGNRLVHGRLGGRVEVVKVIDGDPVGTSYCGPAATNSTGAPAELRAAGSDSASVDNVTLLGSQLPSGSFVLFLASTTQANVPGVGGGQGTLCLGGSIGRYVGFQQIRRASMVGLASLQLDLAAIPQPTGFVAAQAGSTWNFQAWYRDANPGLTSNLTDAVSIVMQ